MTDYLELLYRALGSELGVVIRTDSPQHTTQKLYTVRRSAGDPNLSRLSITPSRTSPATELWIVRKDVVDALTKRPIQGTPTMPRKASEIPLTKHNINLFEGDFTRLSTLFPTLGASIAIRHIVRETIRRAEAAKGTAPLDLSDINAEEFLK